MSDNDAALVHFAQIYAYGSPVVICRIVIFIVWV